MSFPLSPIAEAWPCPCRGRQPRSYPTGHPYRGTRHRFAMQQTTSARAVRSEQHGDRRQCLHQERQLRKQVFGFLQRSARLPLERAVGGPTVNESTSAVNVVNAEASSLAAGARFVRTSAGTSWPPDVDRVRSSCQARSRNPVDAAATLLAPFVNVLAVWTGSRRRECIG